MKTLGIVVAGGTGERLGAGLPKALVSLGGLTLLDRAIGVLEPLCDEVVIATSVRVLLAGARARVVTDGAGAAGPLAGLVAGLRAAPDARAVALGVDLPLVESASLAALMTRLGERSAVIPAPAGRAQPLAAVYGPGAAAALAGALARGERALVAATAALDPLLLPDGELAALGIPVDAFLNLNTPEDLAEAARRIAARPAAGARS